MEAALDELDPAGTLARVEEVLLVRRAAQLEDLQLAAHWADLHARDPRLGPEGRRRRAPGGNKLVQLGGDGTPLVQDLCLSELATARRVHTISVRAAVADVLDLRHRLPRCWAVVQALACEAWVARKIAVLTRALAPEAAAIVDGAVAAALAGQAPPQVLELAEAKVIEVDEAAHQAKLEAERRRRFAALTRCDEFGLRMVIARVEAGDAVWIEGLLDRVADILATRPDLRPDTPAEICRDELRSVAFGWLARPAELLALLLEAADTTGPDLDQDLDPGPDQEPQPDGENAPEEERYAPRLLSVPQRALDFLGRVDLARMAPKATVYVHLHQAAVDGTARGVARVEGLGPMLLEQVRRMLGHARVDLKPVVDLNDRVAVDTYEHPESVRERVWLRIPGEVFPHGCRAGRGVDLDHPVPYDPLGPPGQTGDHNAGPLSRTGHRAKTHLGYRVTQLGLTAYVWSTPHGLHRLVDERGTHLLTEAEAELLTEELPETIDEEWYALWGAAADELLEQRRTDARR